MSEKTTKQIQGEAIAHAWNANHPIGTEVVLVDDTGRFVDTQTRSPAWALGDGSPVVSVNGRSGGYALGRIIPGGAMPSPVNVEDE